MAVTYVFDLQLIAIPKAERHVWWGDLAGGPCPSASIAS